jgi:SAM-dependent methyltransferase
MKNILRKLRLLPDPQAGQELERRQKKQRRRPVPNSRRSYADHVTKLLAANDEEKAMSLAVGGDYDLMGKALAGRLERFGLEPTDYLIDVGCGSGRLAFALAQSKYRDTLRYLGLDIVPAMLEFAATKCRQPAWRFELISDLTIPEEGGRADMVCFFSVFTHLMQEESFLYLGEARRVLRPGGLIVATYLDINAPKHWKIFEANAKSPRLRQEKPMDIFLSTDFFRIWAEKLDLDLVEDHAPDGGQRTCLLRKPDRPS